MSEAADDFSRTLDVDHYTVTVTRRCPIRDGGWLHARGEVIILTDNVDAAKVGRHAFIADQVIDLVTKIDDKVASRKE